MDDSDSEKEKEFEHEFEHVDDIQHAIGTEQMRALEEISEIVEDYEINGELPWRLFHHNSDDFCLWKSATGLEWHGPYYSDDITENGIPIIIERAAYRCLPVSSLQYAKYITHGHMTDKEVQQFESDIYDTPSGSMVEFIYAVLGACNMDLSECNIYRFMYNLDYSNCL